MSRSDKPKKVRRSNRQDFWVVHKRTILFLVIFTVAAIGVTTGAILWKNSSSKPLTPWGTLFGTMESVSDDENIPDESGLTVVRGDIYATNPLNIVHQADGANNYAYIVIDGLKNQDIQNRINDEIRATYYRVKADNSDDPAKVECGVLANFGNILSVVCEYDYSDDLTRSHVWLNFRLDTGEQVDFSDVFTAGANMNQLVATAFYETWSNNHINRECADMIDEFCRYYQPVYPDDIEERALAAVQAFSGQSEIVFYITARSVTFAAGDQVLSLNFNDNSQYIAIYKRFMATDGLYDNQSNRRYGFVFEPAERLVLGQISDNLFADCMSSSYNDNAPLSQELYIINQKVTAAEEEAVKHPDQMTLLTCSTDFSDYTGTSSYSYFRVNTGITLNVEIFRMPKAYFSEIGWARILDANYAPHSSSETFSADAFRDYESYDVTRIKDQQVRFLVDGNWSDLTSEYRAWQRTDCANRFGNWRFNEDGNYCEAI